MPKHTLLHLRHTLGPPRSREALLEAAPNLLFIFFELLLDLVIPAIGLIIRLLRRLIDRSAIASAADVAMGFMRASGRSSGLKVLDTSSKVGRALCLIAICSL